MNQSKQHSEPATKSDLLDLEKRLEDRFEKKFATKHDLQNGLNSLKARIDLKLDKLERRVDEKARIYRDDVLTKLDGVIKELEIAREDR